MAKFVADAEQNLLIEKYAQGISFEHFDDALKAVRRIGPGGHYLDSFTQALQGRILRAGDPRLPQLRAVEGQAPKTWRSAAVRRRNPSRVTSSRPWISRTRGTRCIRGATPGRNFAKPCLGIRPGP
jgi:hypothetical protein